MFAAAGLSKADVQNWLIEQCGRTGARVRAGPGKARASPAQPDGDYAAATRTFHRILPTPQHVPVIVAGAKNAAISMVVRIFGEWSGTRVPVGEKK